MTNIHACSCIQIRDHPRLRHLTDHFNCKYEKIKQKLRYDNGYRQCGKVTYSLNRGIERRLELSLTPETPFSPRKRPPTPCLHIRSAGCGENYANYRKFVEPQFPVARSAPTDRATARRLHWLAQSVMGREGFIKRSTLSLFGGTKQKHREGAAKIALSHRW